MSNAQSGFRGILQKSDGATPPVYTTLAEVVSISGPGLSRGSIDVSNMDSANGAMEFIPQALYDGGEVTFEINWIPSDASQDAVLDDIATEATNAYRIVWPGQTQNAETFAAAAVNTGTEVITIVAHNLGSTQRVTFTTDDTIFDPIVVGNEYWVHVESVNTITLHTNEVDGKAGTNDINLTTQGAGNHTVYSGLSWLFSAFPTGLEPSAAVDSKLAASVTFNVAGAATFQS